MYQTQLTFKTSGRGLTNITNDINLVIKKHASDVGLCHLFIQHTSASLLICENADPDVQKDLESFMSRLVPDGDPLFIHTAEGPDDMPAHIRTLLTETSLTVPVQDKALALGTWQGVYLWEHRMRHHERHVVVTVV